MSEPQPADGNADAADSAAESPQQTHRRGFITHALAVLIGGLITVVPMIVGAVFFLDPLLRRRRAPSKRESKRDEKGFIKVATTDAIPAGGKPRRFTVIADQIDAWNYYPEQRIGSVFLRRTADGPVKSARDVSCFSDECPHLGCSVEYKPGNSDEKTFECPCHASAFTVKGERTNDIPPRDLDELEVEVRGKEVWVKYQKFRIGTAEKTVSG